MVESPTCKSKRGFRLSIFTVGHVQISNGASGTDQIRPPLDDERQDAVT